MQPFNFTCVFSLYPIVLSLRSTHLPLAELEQRAFELPAPFGGELTLLAGNASELATAASWLREKGWTLALLLEWSLDAHAPHVSTSVLPCNDQDSTGSVSGSSSCSDWEIVTGSVSTPCWSPSPFLAQVLEEKLAVPAWLDQWPLPSSVPTADASEGNDNINNSGSSNKEGDKHDNRWVALDLGCGSGRDAVAMALALPADRFRVRA